jgi:nucleoside-diphosphate-sugar epimerase
MNVAISGSNGYLGKKIRNSLKNDGYKTIGLCRKPKNKDDFKFVLDGNSVNHQIFKKNKIETFIHCAWDMGNPNEDQSYKINVIGSKKILDEAIKDGVKKIIFISSMSAYENCKSVYGKQKLEVESYYQKRNASIIRPGLIWGDQKNGGLYKKLNNISKLPFLIPVIFSKKQHLYLLHEDDLIKFIKKKIKTKKINFSINTIANSNALTLKEIINICQIKNGNKAFLILIPWQIIWIIVKIAELLKISVPFKSDSIISLVNSNPNPVFSKHTKRCKAFTL